MSFSTVFHKYTDDGRVIKKAVCYGSLFTVGKISASTELQIRRCIKDNSKIIFLISYRKHML